MTATLTLQIQVNKRLHAKKKKIHPSLNNSTIKEKNAKIFQKIERLQQLKIFSKFRKRKIVRVFTKKRTSQEGRASSKRNYKVFKNFENTFKNDSTGYLTSTKEKENLLRKNRTCFHKKKRTSQEGEQVLKRNYKNFKKLKTRSKNIPPDNWHPLRKKNIPKNYFLVLRKSSLQKRHFQKTFQEKKKFLTKPQNHKLQMSSSFLHSAQDQLSLVIGKR